jgi:hypothetical protein
MLHNEFLKEHRKVEQLQKQVEALTAGLKKSRCPGPTEQPGTANGAERSVARPSFANL